MGLKIYRAAVIVLAFVMTVAGLNLSHLPDRALAEEPGNPAIAAAPYEQYPLAPLPTWVKYQWLSWYAVGMGMNEDYLKAQVDYIADNLADLGPWHILVDAGWYVSEGKPGSDWRNVDSEKFPSGLRALVDYAHARGVRVVLYISVPYINDKNTQGNWLGQAEVIRQHPDWLIPLGSSEAGNGYLYNFDNPELRAYLAEVLRDFFIEYDVDGIKVDGFGDAGREVNLAVQRGRFKELAKPSLQAAEIYEFIYNTAVSLKPDAYIEGGWFPPVTARPYVHTVRYGDEFPAFNYAYPSGGLRQHVDYAIIQRTRLGQRPNIGAVWGDPNNVSVGYQWLEAGLALSAQVVLGFDLPSMNQQVLDGYRARLSQYNAFLAQPIVGGSPDPDVFASRSNRTTYVGAINRDSRRKVIDINFERYGLRPDQSYLVYDVISDSYFRASGSIGFEVLPERFRLFLIRDEIGVMWTNASYQEAYIPGELTIILDGPASLPGYVDIHTPPFQEVYLDDSPLTPNQYEFDAVNNVLSLGFGYDGQRAVRIVY